MCGVAIRDLRLYPHRDAAAMAEGCSMYTHIRQETAIRRHSPYIPRQTSI
jgi:hypothetical protein